MRLVDGSLECESMAGYLSGSIKGHEISESEYLLLTYTSWRCDLCHRC